MSTSPRSSYAYQQARAECLRRSNICWLCGEPIDMTLRWPHPMSPSADHVQPLHDGGNLTDPNNLRPAHLTHNVSRGNRTRQAQAKRTVRSRDW